MIKLTISFTAEQFEEMAKALDKLNETKVGQFRTEDLINFLIDHFNAEYEKSSTVSEIKTMSICLN